MITVMFVKKLWKILCLTLVIATMSGCRIRAAKVCATNYPVYYLINRIGGSYVDACNLSSNDLIQVASVSNTFESDLDEADVIFTISQLEPYSAIYSEEFARASTKTIDLSRTSAIYKFNRYTTTTVNNQQVVVESDYYEGEAFDNIDTYDSDVILWMDPISMMSMAKTIAETLSELYPEYEKDFSARYEELEVDLAVLDTQFQNIRLSNKEISFVSVTPSFGNWQKSYGFNVYPLILSKYGALPSDEQLNLICDRITQDGVKYIAHEENLTEEMEALFNEVKERCNLTEIKLNNISSISDDALANNMDYMTLMYENLSQIEALD